MKPPKREYDYERVPTDNMVTGVIEEIQYEQEHKFTFQGQTKVAPAVRFKFKIEGCQYPHYSRYMSFSYGEKSNLYQKYLLALVDNAEPDMDFDLDDLKGMKLKMLWQERNGFQWPEVVRPVGAKRARPEVEADIEGVPSSMEEGFEIQGDDGPLPAPPPPPVERPRPRGVGSYDPRTGPPMP